MNEAFDIVSRARAAENEKPFRVFHYELDKVYEECLEKQGKVEDLKVHLWRRFEQTLSVTSLRNYLKLLPDFDDIEAEETALDFAETHSCLEVAVSFLVNWPAHARAASLVLTRADELDGNSYHTLSTAAEALEAEHPLAATVMRRAMIEDSLDGAKSKRYRHAARHLEECQSCDAAIEDYGDVLTHAEFIAALKEKHPCKHGFWRLTNQ